MAQTTPTHTDTESTVREYPFDIRIVETSEGRFRFEAPEHQGISFEDRDAAELYVDVYFDVNGFGEQGTGERGVPPEIIQAGRDTLVAYFATQPATDISWIASFYGLKPEKIGRYINRVQKRATQIREGVDEQGLDE